MWRHGMWRGPPPVAVQRHAGDSLSRGKVQLCLDALNVGAACGAGLRPAAATSGRRGATAVPLQTSRAWNGRGPACRAQGSQSSTRVLSNDRDGFRNR